MKKEVFLFLVIFVIVIYGCASPVPEIPKQAQNEVKQTEDAKEPVVEQAADEPVETAEKDTAEQQEEPAASILQWTYGGSAIEGNYADSDFVDLGDGKYRMYYAIEPEVPGNQLEVYSATSTDGINWAPESGVRRSFTVFPDVVKLQDGTWRMYFQNAGVIKSATSNDGLNWKDESGTRIDTKNNEGL